MSFTRQNVFQMISIHFHKRWESIIRLLGLPWLDYSVTANTASADASLARTLKNQNQSPLQLLDIQSTSPSSSRSSDCSNTIQIRPAVVSYRHCRNLQIKWNISFSCFTCLTGGGCHNGMCPWRKKKVWEYGKSSTFIQKLCPVPSGRFKQHQNWSMLLLTSVVSFVYLVSVWWKGKIFAIPSPVDWLEILHTVTIICPLALLIATLLLNWFEISLHWVAGGDLLNGFLFPFLIACWELMWTLRHIDRRTNSIRRGCGSANV